MTGGARIEAPRIPDAAADPRHPDHARWTLERLLRDEAEWKRKMGREPDVAEAQAHWGKTLERVARKSRGRRVTPDRRRQQVDPEKGRLLRDSGHYQRGRRRLAAARCPCPTKDCRSCRIHRRVAELVRVDPATATPCHPAYAVAIAMAMAEAQRASPRDRDRIIRRRIEDIVERSRAHLGPWDVPLVGGA